MCRWLTDRPSPDAPSLTQAIIVQMVYSNGVEFFVTEIGLLCLTFRLAASSETWEKREKDRHLSFLSLFPSLWRSRKANVRHERPISVTNKFSRLQNKGKTTASSKWPRSARAQNFLPSPCILKRKFSLRKWIGSELDRIWLCIYQINIRRLSVNLAFK